MTPLEAPDILNLPGAAAVDEPRSAPNGSIIWIAALAVLLAEVAVVIFWFDAFQPGAPLFTSGIALPLAWGRVEPLLALLFGAAASAVALQGVGLTLRLIALATFCRTHRHRLARMVIAVGVAGAAAAVWALRAFANSGDEYDFLFEAQTFLAGRLWNPAPPLPDLFAFFHITIKNGEWVALYPPGWPALLAAAMALRLPAWVACPVAAGLLLFCVIKLGDRRDGPLGGVLAGALVAFSSFFLFNAGSYFTQIPAAAAGLAYCWAGLSFLERPGWRNVVMTGTALGVLGLIRPEDVPVFALPFAVELLWRARRRHYRFVPLIGLAGLPFLLVLVLFYQVVSGTLGPDLSGTPVRFGLLNSVDEFGNLVSLPDKLSLALTRIVMLAEWSSPLLVAGFVAAFAWLAAKRRLSFVDLIFPCFVLAYLLVPFDGGNQYGPRYYFAGFPTLVLTLVSALAQLLEDAERPRRAGLLWSLVLAHTSVCAAGIVVIGVWMRMTVDERMDVYDQARALRLHHVVVVLHSSTSRLSPMDPRDLTRNGIDLDGDVIYVRDIPDQIAALHRLIPDRRFYVYERAVFDAAGNLRLLAPPATER